MSNIFKLRPTHFSRGAKYFLRGDSPPLVTGLSRAHGKAATIASYRVFHILGKHNEPSEDSNILKEAFLEAATNLFENFKNKT